MFALEVLALEAWEALPARVTLVEVLRLLDLAGEEAAAERRVGHEADAKLAYQRQDRLLHRALPQRVLGLQRRDRVHGVRAADRLGACLGEPQVANLALFDQLGHRPDRLLDLDLGIDPVLVVEVDLLDPQASQRGLAALAHVGGVATNAEELALVAAYVAELGGDHHAVAAIGDRATDELLVRERAVHVRRVEQRHPQLERAVDRGDRLALVGRPIELGHAHAPEPLLGDDEALATEWTLGRRHGDGAYGGQPPDPQAAPVALAGLSRAASGRPGFSAPARQRTTGRFAAPASSRRRTGVV